ncbi:glycosyltransferase involved in cell wall biosynthesis [Cryobacterium sp. MP_M3]|uniref:glycosyltransferase family 4 protein n=1 Tax=unclassified Cryobacterium TaxID=2649013 RepID=UPI001A285737|nr:MULTISPECIES: glycosyltransferase family 1 protein [unclassified Cryobacterium]MBG6056998.1 glycosyltransferase involved in cell wall biosynthesis [Cryobacterium sp. MP_M3]
MFSPGFNAGITRARQILVIHDLIHLQVDAERTFLKTLFYGTIVRRAIRRAGVVMTVSRTSAEAIAGWVGTAHVDIEVVGNGCSSSFVSAGDRTGFSFPTFLYVGNFKPHKNVDVVLDALLLRPDYRLLVVTGDVERARTRVAEKGLTRQVDIRSDVTDEELAALYRGVAGSVQPSILEGFGLPALESLSCGTPVAYWAGCESVAEICAGTGVAVIASGVPQEWAAALDSLKEISDQGPVVMPSAWRAEYDWDTVAHKVTQVLSRVGQ